MAKHQLTLLDASWTLAGSCKLTRLPADASCNIDDSFGVLGLLIKSLNTVSAAILQYTIESAGHKIGLPTELRIKIMCLYMHLRIHIHLFFYLIICSFFSCSFTFSKIIHLSHFEPYLDTHLATFHSPKSSGTSQTHLSLGGSGPSLFT